MPALLQIDNLANFVNPSRRYPAGEDNGDSRAPANRYSLYLERQIANGERLARNRLTRIRRGQINGRRCPRNFAFSNEESRSLAASSLALPGDGRPRRRPSLERQDAFRETTDAADDVELYRLGILYDDESSRGSGFALNTITHSEPLYHVRPAKRSKRRQQKTDFDNGYPALALDLSFSGLASDDALARFLASTSDNYTLTADAAIQHRMDGGSVPARSRAPLPVIYELQDSKDFLSPTLAVDIIPDLVSDSEGEEEEDWAVLASDGTVSNAEEAEDDAAAASTTGAWVMLGDGS